MKTIKSTCGKYAVEFVSYNRGGTIMACAVMCDGQSYGGNSYWFTIGRYKTEKMALRQAVKKMANHNIELEAAAIAASA